MSLNFDVTLLLCLDMRFLGLIRFTFSLDDCKSSAPKSVNRIELKTNVFQELQLVLFMVTFIGGDSAVKLLTKFGLLESAIDYAAENW